MKKGVSFFVSREVSLSLQTQYCYTRFCSFNIHFPFCVYFSHPFELDAIFICKQTKTVCDGPACIPPTGPCMPSDFHPLGTPVTHSGVVNGLSWAILIPHSILEQGQARWAKLGYLGAPRWPQKGCRAPQEFKDNYLSHTGNPGGPGGPIGPEGPVIPWKIKAEQHWFACSDAGLLLCN